MAEETLKDKICKALDLECIGYRIIRDTRDNSLEVNIQNWENYLKLWSIKVFDRCQRKKEKFCTIAKRLRVYFRLKQKFRKQFFRSLQLLQREIAQKIGSWQGNVSGMISGQHLLNTEYLTKLISYSKYSKCDVIKNVGSIRIGCLTNLKLSRQILTFLKEFGLL